MFWMGSPIFFIFPLILFFAIARVVMRLIGGASRRDFRQIPDEYRARPEVLDTPARPLIRGRGSDESKIFRLALKLKGRLTVSDVVIETGLGLHEAEALIEGMVDNVHVRMEVDSQGRVIYEFPEIIRRLDGSE